MKFEALDRIKPGEAEVSANPARAQRHHAGGPTHGGGMSAWRRPDLALAAAAGCGELRA